MPAVVMSLETKAPTARKSCEKHPEDIQVEQWVIAVGNPFGLGGSVTAGIVSALGRNINANAYDDFIRIDAPVNRGNSGGPTFDYNGSVIGVNTAIFSPSGGNVGIAFAIPASIAAQVVNDRRDDGKVSRGFLGVTLQPVSADIVDALELDTLQAHLSPKRSPTVPQPKLASRTAISSRRSTEKMSPTAVNWPERSPSLIPAIQRTSLSSATVKRWRSRSDW